LDASKIAQVLLQVIHALKTNVLQFVGMERSLGLKNAMRESFKDVILIALQILKILIVQKELSILLLFVLKSKMMRNLFRFQKFHSHQVLLSQLLRMFYLLMARY